MSKIHSILEAMAQPVQNPRAAVAYFKEQGTNRHVIGCAPEYCPEEIIHAAGMLPVGMWGGKTAIAGAAAYFPSFACPMLQSTLELGLRGVYDQLSAVIIPSHCDHLKCFGQDWKVAIPQVRVLQFAHPFNSKLETAIAYLQAEYRRIKTALEEIGGQPITDEALHHSIDVYNTHRRVMREFTRIAPDYPVTITPQVRHLVMKSGYFMDKAEHTGLVQRLIDALGSQPPEGWQGQRVVLTGMMSEPEELLDLLTEYGLTVVADDLAQESRQFRVDVPEGRDPMERLARQWSNMYGCSLVYDPRKEHRFLIRDLARETKADGVIACVVKFCEMEEFDYPIYLKTMEEAGIPLLNLEVDLLSRSLEQARTRIQSFAEMLAVRSS